MPEKQNIEWKAKWSDEYLKWICGFANAQGGRIFIGYDDDGHIVGVDHAKKLLEDIPNKIRDAMGIVADVNLQEEASLPYIEITVPPYPIGISCKGVYYYRSGSTRQILTGPALESFLLRKRGMTWDNLPFPAFTLQDIDDDAVQKFRDLAAKQGRIAPALLKEPTDVLLTKLHLIHQGQLTHAAVLLFSKDPEEWLPGAFLKIGFFRTDDDLRYQDEVHGSLLEQVDQAVSLIYFKYMKAYISYEGLQRIERYFVPEEALREALINAICHKQYQSCIPVQVSVYEDRLYVANAGDLPLGWTVENLLQKHASNPYNPILAHVLFLAGFIESWGRGIEKIHDACQREGQPVPEYTIHPGDFMIKFTASFPKRSDIAEQITARTELKLSNTEKQLLELFLKNPNYTTRQLENQLPISRKTILKWTKRLQDIGILKRIGSPRYGHWIIQMPGQTGNHEG